MQEIIKLITVNFGCVGEWSITLFPLFFTLLYIQQMEYTINELRQKIFQKVFATYDIFKEFFGEEYVDLQNIPDNDDMESSLLNWDCHESELEGHEGSWEVSDDNYNRISRTWESLVPEIYVWWPEVTVTNEYDKSVKIRDLYAKIPMTMNAMIPAEGHGFYLTRSTYNPKQWIRGYCHSHVPSFSREHGAPRFQAPCLGRGPIKHTITCLKTDNDVTTWMMFCQELALYVTVESLTGVPYIKLESIDAWDRRRLINNSYEIIRATPTVVSLSNSDSKAKIRQFIAYYLVYGHLTFNYQDGHYTCSMPYYNFMVDISNCFIQWFNKNGNAERARSLFDSHVLVPVQVDEGSFYSNPSLTSFDVDRLREQKILTFKGQDVMLSIEGELNASEAPTLILDHDLALYMLECILKIINYRYRNEHTNNTGRTAEAPASTYQTVCYL